MTVLEKSPSILMGTMVMGDRIKPLYIEESFEVSSVADLDPELQECYRPSNPAKTPENEVESDRTFLNQIEPGRIQSNSCIID